MVKICLAFFTLNGCLRNAVTVSWALDLTPDSGFKFVALHPGLVRTDMASKAFK
jgi:hypothetical protein